ncbi:MAG: T9SS type A sorting domain-containing protein [Bacteroidota bacterium]
MKNSYLRIIFLTIIGCCGFTAQTLAQTAPTVGSGTEADPYEVSTYDHLKWISETDQNTTPTWTYHYIQTANIDASASSTDNDGDGFLPISETQESNSYFTGVYDGSDYEISNLFIDRVDDSGEDFIGLFSGVRGSVKNVRLVGANITGRRNVGALAGDISYSTSTIGVIDNCHVDSTSIITSTEINSGGLIGQVAGGVLRNSSSSAAVNGIDRVGGLVGELRDVLNNNGLIERSYATGNVTGVTNVGGFVGRQNSDANVLSNCYARGDVQGEESVGGFIGNHNRGVVEYSYSTGQVVLVNGAAGPVGGFSGSFDTAGSGAISTANFWDNETSNQSSSASGTGEATANMTDDTIFLTAGWDFVCETTNGTEFIWNVDATLNDSYPNLEGEEGALPVATQPAGDGSSGSPWQIESLENLYWLTTTPSSWGDQFVQTQNIDASATEDWGCLSSDIGWTPIGANDSGTDFTGVYDGQGYTIDGLFIDADSYTSAGFFEEIAGGAVVNLSFTNTNFSGAIDNLGVLAGVISGGEINTVYIEANNTLESTATSSNVGGLVGLLENGVIRESYANAAATGQGNVGGFVGSMSGGDIDNAFSRATVNTDGGQAGGFVGIISGGTIDKTYTTSSVTVGTEGTANAFGLEESTEDLVTNSFYDSEILTADNSNASGQITANMTQETIFLEVGWDFVCEIDNGTDDIWRILSTENDAYPFFDNEFESPDLTPEGLGTQGDPYQIANLGNLIWLGENPTEWSAYYIQTADIDVSESLEFACEGDSDTFQIIAQGVEETFSGNYDGQNFSIQNLTLNESDDRIAFFGTLDGATIQNLNFTGATITGNSNIGVLAGIVQNNTTVSNIDITTSSVTQNEGIELQNIGGVAGSVQNSNLSEINLDATITSEGINTGGIAGAVDNSILTNLIVAGTISGNNETGGVVGFAQNSTSIDNANVSASISANDDSENIGGIAGQLTNSSVANSSLTTAISIPTANNLGGIVGNMDTGDLSNNSVGSVSISGNNDVGGIVGVASTVNLNDNTNQASVTGTNNIGGIAGSLSGTDSSLSANSNETVIDGADNVGGIVGSLTGTIENASNNTNTADISGADNVGGLYGTIDAAVDFDSLSVENITITGETNVGGLIGSVSSTATVDIFQSFTAGVTFTGGSGSNIGGLIGLNNASISESYVQNFTMNYTTSLTNAGGFVGEMSGGDITDAYVLSTGATTFETSGGAIGGFVGNATGGTITRAYATVNSSENGFTGTGTTTIEQSFYDNGLAADGTDATATATSTAGMQTESTYTTSPNQWDFECEDDNGTAYIWGINTTDNELYPFLTWQGFESECTFDDYTWTGDVDNDWGTAGNWSNNTIPPASEDISIPSNPTEGRFPVLDENRTVGTVQLSSGATITLNGNTLTVEGNILGTGEFVGSKTSSLELNTGGSIDLRMSQASDEASNMLENLTINRAGESVTLTGTTYVNNVLDVQDGNLISNGNLVMYCDWDNNNRVGQIDVLDDGASISGEIITEQCFPARRAFRLLSPSVNMTRSIHESWQENAIDSNDDPKPGYGTHITGIDEVNTEIVTTENGFDWNPSGNPSMFTYSISNQEWQAVTSGTNTTLSAGNARRIMIRGDRSIDITDNATPPTNTKLRTFGNVYSGNYELSSLGDTPNADDFILQGSRYQAQVDLAGVIDRSTNINPYVYYWDPTLGGSPIPGEPGGRGAWVALDFSEDLNNPTKNYIGDQSGISDINRFLQPMQAVLFVATGGGSPNISFQETDKAVTESQTEIFSQSTSDNHKKISLELYREDDLLVNSTPADALKLFFSESGNNDLDETDIPKMDNLDENLASIVDSELISIQRRALPQNEETISLFVNQYVGSNYTLRINADDFGELTPYLKDNYTGDLTPINEGENLIEYTIDASINQSMSYSRFEILFSNETFSTSDFENDQFSVYPNPVKSEQLFVAAPTLGGEQTTVSIYNMLGKVVYQQKAQFSANGKLELSDLDFSAGVYTLKVNTESGASLTHKIIKK